MFCIANEFALAISEKAERLSEIPLSCFERPPLGTVSLDYSATGLS